MTALDRLDDLLFTPPTLEEQVRWMRETYPWAFEPARPDLSSLSLTHYLGAHGLVGGHDTVMSWVRGLRSVPGQSDVPYRRRR